MINPLQITNFNRTEAELEEFLLFAVVVAGKNATIQAQKLEQFLSGRIAGSTPFEYIDDLGENLESALRACKLGQYTRIAKCFREVSLYRIEKLMFQDLISIHGISNKTANFFLLHSRKDYVGCALDVHILKFIRTNGYPDAPKQTPPPSKYEKWQNIFIDLCNRLFPDKSLAEADLEIWKSYKLA